MNATLQRQLGVPGAVALGLGSMVGTGVFVALGLGAGVAGEAVVLAVVLAGGLACCNALSSAQLAAAHPVAGGTYEYGHRYLTPALGAVAGVTFLIAKSASAATAALGLSAYGLSWLGVNEPGFRIGVGLIVLLGVMSLVLEGMRRTTMVNTLIVGVTLAGLAAFVLAVLAFGEGRASGEAFVTAAKPEGLGTGLAIRSAPRSTDFVALAHATALMFVAYTGYGRIATCAEEVRDPGRTIPRAVLATMAVTITIYLAVVLAALSVVTPEGFAELTRRSAAPLEAIAESIGAPSWLTLLIAGSAMTAMFGVLLNLVVGLSRVALAMGRRGHLPLVFARVDEAGHAPGPAVLLVTAVVGVLIALGSIERAWSLSAVTVLIYYGLTNAAALRLPAEDRRFPRVIGWVGLVGCFGLSLTLEPAVVALGLGFVVAALGLHGVTGTRRTAREEARVQ